MKTMNASDFKARCLKVLDNVAADGEPVLILKRGKPVAQLGPVSERRAQEGLRGTVHILGDVISPVLPANDWDVEGGDLN